MKEQCSDNMMFSPTIAYALGSIRDNFPSEREFSAFVSSNERILRIASERLGNDRTNAGFLVAGLYDNHRTTKHVALSGSAPSTASTASINPQESVAEDPCHEGPGFAPTKPTDSDQFGLPMPMDKPRASFQWLSRCLARSRRMIASLFA
jgi:hypothetical protein